MRKLLLIIFLQFLISGCSSFSSTIKDDEDFIKSNTSLVRNIAHTYDAGGYTKEAAKNLGKPTLKLSANDKKFEISSLQNSLKTLKVLRDTIPQYINLKINEYKKTNLNTAQKKRIQKLKSNTSLLEKLIDSNIKKGSRLLNDMQN